MDRREMILKNPKVIDEINKHKWIESEKAGRDIGWDVAVEGWMATYADSWKKGMPKAAPKPKKTASPKRKTAKRSSSKSRSTKKTASKTSAKKR